MLTEIKQRVIRQNSKPVVFSNSKFFIMFKTQHLSPHIYLEIDTIFKMLVNIFFTRSDRSSYVFDQVAHDFPIAAGVDHHTLRCWFYADSQSSTVELNSRYSGSFLDYGPFTGSSPIPSFLIISLSVYPGIISQINSLPQIPILKSTSMEAQIKTLRSNTMPLIHTYSQLYKKTPYK